MRGVEGLGVCGLVIDHTHSSNMINYMSIFCVVEVLSTVISPISTGSKDIGTFTLEITCFYNRENWLNFVRKKFVVKL